MHLDVPTKDVDASEVKIAPLIAPAPNETSTDVLIRSHTDYNLDRGRAMTAQRLPNPDLTPGDAYAVKDATHYDRNSGRLSLLPGTGDAWAADLRRRYPGVSLDNAIAEARPWVPILPLLHSFARPMPINLAPRFRSGSLMTGSTLTTMSIPALPSERTGRFEGRELPASKKQRNGLLAQRARREIDRAREHQPKRLQDGRDGWRGLGGGPVEP